MFIDFLDFFHPPLVVYCSYVHTSCFHKNATLHVYSNLHVYLFCNFCTPSTVIREMRVLTYV